MLLTGPISRGDLGTVRKHLQAMESYAPSLLPLYCESALGAVKLALEKGGIDGATESELCALLEEWRVDFGAGPKHDGGTPIVG